MGASVIGCLGGRAAPVCARMSCNSAHRRQTANDRFGRTPRRSEGAAHRPTSARDELCVDGIHGSVECPDHPCPAANHRCLKLPEQVQIVGQAAEVKHHFVPALEQALALAPQTTRRRRERFRHVGAFGPTLGTGEVVAAAAAVRRRPPTPPPPPPSPRSARRARRRHAEPLGGSSAAGAGLRQRGMLGRVLRRGVGEPRKGRSGLIFVHGV